MAFGAIGSILGIIDAPLGVTLQASLAPFAASPSLLTPAREIRAALQGRIANYNYQKVHSRFDTDTFVAIHHPG